VSQQQLVFWLQVYAEKNSQNMKMEQIAAGSTWDVNDEVTKAREFFYLRCQSSNCPE
jgi:hypothetical protein